MSINFDRKFINRLKQREEAACTMLFEETGPMIFNYVLYRVGGRREVAEDIHSEIYCEAINHIQNLTFNHNVKGWLYRIARSRIGDYFRRLIRENKWKVSIPLETLNLESELDGPEWALLVKEHNLLIKAAMLKLEDKHKEMLKLKYIDKKSVKEIAEKQQVTPKAVEALLYRARNQFREELKNLSKEKIYKTEEAVE